MGYSPWGRKESDTTERLHFLSLSLSFSSSTVFLLGWWFGLRRLWPPLCPRGPGWPEESCFLALVIGSPRTCDSSRDNQSHQSFLAVFTGLNYMVLLFKILRSCSHAESLFWEWSKTCQAALRETVVQRQLFDPYIPLCLKGECPSNFSALWAIHSVLFFLNESEFRFDTCNWKSPGYCNVFLWDGLYFLHPIPSFGRRHSKTGMTRVLWFALVSPHGFCLLFA